MPPFIPHLAQIAQLPIAQAGQLLLVTGISFVVIVLIASTYRFHRMIQLGEEDLSTPEACNDFFFIQVTRYLSKINRTSSGFGILIVQFASETPDQRRVQEELLGTLKDLIRNTVDKACLFRDDCVAAIIDTEEEQVGDAARRIASGLKSRTSALTGPTALRIGISSFPLNGINTQTLIDQAENAMESVDFSSENLFCAVPSPEDHRSEETDEKPQPAETEDPDRNSALDPLTGVLSPTVVGSYMRKYLADLRHKKQPASVLCVGINRIQQIIDLHGEASADEVIAGVSKVLQRLTRNSDLIGRYHRDDFLILIPCALSQGELIAARLREAVYKNSFFSQGKRIKASISIGITSFPEHGRNLRDLFRGAYQALETVRNWNTSACLVYDPAQHTKNPNA